MLTIGLQHGSERLQAQPRVWNWRSKHWAVLHSFVLWQPSASSSNHRASCLELSEFGKHWTCGQWHHNWSIVGLVHLMEVLEFHWMAHLAEWYFGLLQPLLAQWRATSLLPREYCLGNHLLSWWHYGWLLWVLIWVNQCQGWSNRNGILEASSTFHFDQLFF